MSIITAEDIKDYIGSISALSSCSQLMTWLNGLTLLAKTYDSAKQKIVDHFSFFKDMLNSEITAFHKPIMDCLKVLSTSKVTNTHIVRDSELVEALDDLRTSNSYNIYASDAKEVLWNSSRESGQIPILPTICCALGCATAVNVVLAAEELFSVDFPANFEITSKLGQGSFGTVFLVQDKEHPDLKKFVAKQIKIDNIKQTTMGSLASYIHEKGGLNEQKTSLFTKQVLEGLNYLHQENILHLDIKGNNILLESEFSVKIADFGLSKIVEKNNDPLVVEEGTVRYIAPEVIAGTSDTEYYSRADIWSVGCTVVEMITKKPPNASIPSPKAVLNVFNNEDLVFTLPEHSSKELKDFLDKTFTQEPRKRPSAEQLLQTDRFLLGNF
ncbi:mitogen-activated protein kinase kinase kinase 2-like [Physella acuta]|uniref:mitogen-activated protein kinase kinase kinase 2-like n=1 Tax=Physella acuta TaxID=109671 RepID=UPI0027DDAE44|nr:mitogen-activated protein kinase kinase kinase 2-like [Physella acuta]